MGERRTRAEAAEQLGVTRQRVEELIKAGRLPEQYETGAGHYIDSDDVERARASLDVDKKTAQASSKPAIDPQVEMLHRQHNLAKTKSAILKTQELELDLSIKKGEYVASAMVRATGTMAGKMLAQRLGAACQQLAPQVCVLKDQEAALALLRRVLIDGVLADFRNDIAGAAPAAPDAA
jgi:excisionase family DNA binding protein